MHVLLFPFTSFSLLWYGGMNGWGYFLSGLFCWIPSPGIPWRFLVQIPYGHTVYFYKFIIEIHATLILPVDFKLFPMNIYSDVFTLFWKKNAIGLRKCTKNITYSYCINIGWRISRSRINDSHISGSSLWGEKKRKPHPPPERLAKGCRYTLSKISAGQIVFWRKSWVKGHRSCVSVTSTRRFQCLLTFIS